MKNKNRHLTAHRATLKSGAVRDPKKSPTLNLEPGDAAGYFPASAKIFGVGGDSGHPDRAISGMFESGF
jgi:hypothetical protein